MKINQIIVRQKTSNFSDFRIVQTREMFHWPQVVKVTRSHKNWLKCCLERGFMIYNFQTRILSSFSLPC